MEKVVHTSTKTKLKVYEINKETKKGTYYVNPECALYKQIKKIALVGFDKLPKGFSTDGYGFVAPAGTFLTTALSGMFPSNIKMIICKKQKSSFVSSTKELTINHDDYLTILEPLKQFRSERNIKSNQHVNFILKTLFPRRGKAVGPVKTLYSYEDDKLSKIIDGNKDIYKLLSKKDIDSICQLNTQLESQNKTEFKYIALHENNRKRNERAFLETIVKEFESRLKKVLSESDWQQFFRKYILLFNTSYVKAIEKLNVDLRGKYPDFALVNVYNYLDIFEIKKPSTVLLKHDESRDNYYWDTEIAKAIIQTEKYIQMITKKSLDVKDIIKEKYNIEVKIVRPRGYVIAGTGTQLVNSKMEDDFRILSSSQKNIDIILYDDLINNLKILIQRLR